MKISAIIVDDEPLARKLIENLLVSIQEIEIIDLCGTGKEAIKSINELHPDIIFLDIQLKDMTGFDVLEKISIKIPLTIFVTAFDSYAIKAFDIFAFDYLLKPYNEKRFYQSVNKAIDTFKKGENKVLENTVADLLNHLQSTKQKLTTSFNERIPISSGNKTIFVYPDDILYIAASNYYVEIYTKKTKHLLRNSMNNLIQKLDSNKFIRIHRSSIININCIEELISSNHGEVDVKMHDNKKFRVSKSYRKEFLTKIGVRK